MKNILISFESGHYKEVTGAWKGDSVWAHFVKEDGTQVHVNKDKVEYMEVREFVDPNILAEVRIPHSGGKKKK